MNNSTPASAIRAALIRALAVAMLISQVACRVNADTAPGELMASVADAKSLAVTNENGSVELVKDAAVTTMQVTARIECVAESKEAAEARVKATKLIAERGSDGRVRVHVAFPPRVPGVIVAYTPMSRASEDSAAITIRAASLDGIEVTSSNGSISSGAFGGTATFKTSNGSISVDGHAGPLTMDTSNGSIKASNVGTPLVADTSNGRVEIALAPTATGNVKIDTSNGSVTLDLPAAWQGTVKADTSNGTVRMEDTRKGARTNTVKNDDDGASMTVGDATKAKATIDTSNGPVKVRVTPN
jgi:Putative adhesin